MRNPPEIQGIKVFHTLSNGNIALTMSTEQVAALSVLGRRNGCSLVDRAFKFSNFLDTKKMECRVYIYSLCFFMFRCSLTMRPQRYCYHFPSSLTWYFVCSTCEEGFDPGFVTGAH